MKRLTVGLVCMLAAGMTFGQAPAAPKTTLDNLQAAYAADADAQQQFAAYAVKADGEGYKGVATLFRALVKQQDIRAAKHSAILKKAGATVVAAKAAEVEAKSTKENLDAALQSLIKQRDVTYPQYAKQAESDKNASASMNFKGGAVVTGDAVKLVEQAAKDLNAWKAAKTLRVCEVCAEIIADPTVVKCPICAAPKERFVTVK